VADAAVRAIDSKSFDFVLINFANPDMVGHTGVLGAAVSAVECVDESVGLVVDAALRQNGAVLITADHGNCELMIDPESGQPHTAHTTNPVPLLYVNDADKGARIAQGGRICDVTVSMLKLLGLAVPKAMTGNNLIER
jgi:2,3-bisphosphoglycerate-independent phosphoglycerate mutase